MILECPNLLSACQELLRNPDVSTGPGQEGQRSMWVFYGDPALEGPVDDSSVGILASQSGAGHV